MLFGIKILLTPNSVVVVVSHYFVVEGCAYANLMRNGAINKPYCNDSHQTISTYIKKNETAFLELIK